MPPPTLFCPHTTCPARGQPGGGPLGRHSQQEQRCIGRVCHKPFSATTGTVGSRLRPSAETVVIVVTGLAQGCPVPALVAAGGFDERTVADGWARAGRQGQAVPEYLVEAPRDWGQVPAEESRVTTPGRSVWVALALMVTPRVWLGGEVSAPRDLPLIRRLLERVRRCAAHRPLVVCPEGLAAYLRAMRETCRDPVPTGTGGRPRRRPWQHGLSAPVVKRYERRRVVETARRIVAGTPARVETLRCRSPGARVITTAYMARLHATFRERLAPLARRCRALARHPLTWPEGMVVVGTGYNVCTPQARLSQAHKPTPARAAGITDHGWTRHDRLSLHVPLSRWSPPQPRGRPSPALKRLLEPWCGDHGSLWIYLYLHTC